MPMSTALPSRRNHVIKADAPQHGREATAASAPFTDAAKLDFRPAVNSPAAKGGTPLQCVPADADGRPYDATSPSRGCFQAK